MKVGFRIAIAATGAVALVLAAAGCDAAAVDKEADANMAAMATSAPENSGDAPAAEAVLPQQIDPEPVASEVPLIVSKSDVTAGDNPACAFTIRYPGHVDQDVTWAKEHCADVETRFLNGADLNALGLLDKLTGDARDDVERLSGAGIFYVESRFTASLFPLNVAGVAYEVPVRD
jgi:hypothetical protein